MEITSIIIMIRDLSEDLLSSNMSNLKHMLIVLNYIRTLINLKRLFAYDTFLFLLVSSLEGIQDSIDQDLKSYLIGLNRA